MQKLIPELIRLNIPFIFILVFAALAVTGAFWLYRNTTPQTKTAAKYLMGGLRAAVLLMLLLLFLAPKLTLTFREKVKTEVNLYLDNSRSMAREGKGLIRPSTLEKLQQILPSNTEASWNQFNSRVLPFAGDSLVISERGTNFSAVLDHIKTENPNIAVIISDGNYTEGGYPLSAEANIQTKIFTIGAGPVEAERDVFIARVYHEPVVYQGQKQTIEARLSSSRLKQAKPLAIKLYNSDNFIASKMVTLDQKNAEQSVFFELSQQQIGLQKLQVKLENLENEINILNNNFTFIQNVLKGKIEVGLFSQAPAYENKFLKLLLSGHPDIRLSAYTGSSNRPPFQEMNFNKMDSLDVIIMDNYPAENSDARIVNKLNALLAKGRAGLILIMGNKTDPSRLNNMLRFLPISKTPLKTRTMPTDKIDISGQSSGLSLNLFRDPDLNQRFLDRIPPLEVAFQFGKLKPDADQHLSARIKNKTHPILLTYESKNTKSVLLNGSGFWKWYFYLQNEPAIQKGYPMMLERLIRWAGNKSDLQPVVLNSTKKAVYLGEKIDLTGYIYDGNFEAVTDGDLNIEVEWNGQKFNVDARNDSSGRYVAQFLAPGEGRYSVSASGYLNGTKLGSDRLEIEVIPFDREVIRTSQNRMFLQRLARFGNGAYYDISRIDSLAANLSRKNETVLNDRIYELWYLPSILFLIVIFISLEWIIRKRFRLV